MRDDGKGIPKDQIPLAIKRFHTSKISNFNDLFTISTLGFRGALASIASVAHLSIISSNGNNEGAELSIFDGKIGELTPAAIIDGTQITIRDLFYNTPARKKFLKTPRTESRKIIDRLGDWYIKVKCRI